MTAERGRLFAGHGFVDFSRSPAHDVVFRGATKRAISSEGDCAFSVVSIFFT